MWQAAGTQRGITHSPGPRGRVYVHAHARVEVGDRRSPAFIIQCDNAMMG